MPASRNRPTTSVRNARLALVSHPWFDVIWSSASGTSVTCVGLTSRTRSMYRSMGLPSMLSSVVICGLIALTSAYLMCRSSGLGCTVMPSAPNISQSAATLRTSGWLPPRALRSVATLLMLTLNLVICKQLNVSLQCHFRDNCVFLHTFCVAFSTAKILNVYQITTFGMAKDI